MRQAQDFKDESAALFDLVSDLSDDEFDTPTAFKTWTFNHILAHLHVFNEAVCMTLDDGDEFKAWYKNFAKDTLATNQRDAEKRAAGGLSGRALCETWRAGAENTADRFAQLDPKLRLPWVGPSMSARSSITARQMETWAHGQAIFDEMSVVREDTDRLKNIAVLGVNTYGWTYQVRGLEAPQPAPFVWLTAPSGDIWDFGEPGDDKVSGSAVEFCQVVTQTRNIADTRLETTGPNSTAWMEIAQCFAGGEEPPPMPGHRKLRAQPV